MPQNWAVSRCNSVYSDADTYVRGIDWGTESPGDHTHYDVDNKACQILRGHRLYAIGTGTETKWVCGSSGSSCCRHGGVISSTSSQKDQDKGESLPKPPWSLRINILSHNRQKRRLNVDT